MLRALKNNIMWNLGFVSFYQTLLFTSLYLSLYICIYVARNVKIYSATALGSNIIIDNIFK